MKERVIAQDRKAVKIGRNKSDRAKAVVFMKERVITYTRREGCED